MAAGYVAQIGVGVLVADFLTAVFHWLEDNYLPWTDAPGVLGEVARDNEMHHAVPFSITTTSWFENMQVTTTMSLTALLVAWLVAPEWVVRYRWGVGAAVLTGSASNLVHRWLHERECTRPWAVTALQRCKILASREEHHSHHQDPSQKYGVVLGFTNAVYDTLGVWDALETVLLLAVGLEAQRKGGVTAYDPIRDPEIREVESAKCSTPLPLARVLMYKQRLADWRQQRIKYE